jgi:hypothetical protein
MLPLAQAHAAATVFLASDVVKQGNLLPGTELTKMELWDGIHQVVIRNLSGYRYLCQQLAYLVLCRIFLKDSKIGLLLKSYQKYPAKSVGKLGEEFLIVELERS